MNEPIQIHHGPQDKYLKRPTGGKSSIFTKKSYTARRQEELNGAGFWIQTGELLPVAFCGGRFGQCRPFWDMGQTVAHSQILVSRFLLPFVSWHFAFHHGHAFQ